jgi:dihydrofolate reductase
MLPQAERMYLTLVAANPQGDAYFPEWSPACWPEASRRDRARDKKNPYDLTFLVLERICAD